MKTKILLFLFSGLVIFSCQKVDFPVEYRLDLPEESYRYADSIDFQNVMPFVFENTPVNNQISDEGATLGRVLFYDTKLSVNNITACASCHFQENAFADPRPTSVGFFNEQTKRNSIGLGNLRFQPDFFWDSRAHELEAQVMMPIADHLEMGMEDEENLIAKLSTVDYYPALFEAAFGSDEVTHERISLALAQFLRSMYDMDSKYDKYMGMSAGEPNFTPAEERGRVLFMEDLHCGTCHNGNNLSGWGTANIGLDMEYSDQGAGAISMGSPGAFKIPSLRNVALTAPYMHDGRFTTLEEVIQHYTTEVKQHESLDFRLRVGGWNNSLSPDLIFFPDSGVGDGDAVKLNLSPTQVSDIITFLETLTDEVLIRDPRFSNPFVRVN